MRRLALCLTLGVALLLAACGGPATQQGLNEAGTAISAPEVGTTVSDGLTEAGTTVSGAISEAATAVMAPEADTVVAEVATAVAAPEAGTAVAEATGALSAVADDVTLAEGEQLILDATQSAGEIADYQWTITQAPTGAETVVGQVITEGSSGNVTLDPTAYEQYFPVAGSYTIQLTVTDMSGQTSTDDFTIDVP